MTVQEQLTHLLEVLEAVARAYEKRGTEEITGIEIARELRVASVGMVVKYGNEEEK